MPCRVDAVALRIAEPVFGAAPLRRGGRIVVCVPVLCQEEAVEQQILLQQEATAAARVSAMCSCSARLRSGEEGELLSVFQFNAIAGDYTDGSSAF